MWPFRRPPNTTQGFPSREPPTPYVLLPRGAPGGIGTSNLAYQRSHTQPRDSVRGRQGICVQRTLNPAEPAFYTPRAPLRASNIVANAAGVNATPGVEALWNPKAQRVGNM